MKGFAALYDAIDRTTSTNAKVDAMAAYFAAAPPADAAWAVFFLTGRRLKRLLPYASINSWTLAATGVPRVAARRMLFGRRRRRRNRGAGSRSAAVERIRGFVAGAMGRRSRPPAQGPRPADAAAASHDVVAVARPPAALHPAQAADRRISRRRLANARRPRACPGGRAAAADARRPNHGRVDAVARVVYLPPLAANLRRRPVAAVSILSGIAARRSDREPGDRQTTG